MFGHGGRQAETGKDQVSYLGDPDVSFVNLAAAFGIKGETVTHPGQIKPAMKNAIQATKDGRPYLIDALVERTGVGAESTWYPKLSVAAMRKRAV
jgi:thiamine pyrophosphate-dependent acetolactate synthase large subunit-like protein